MNGYIVFFDKNYYSRGKALVDSLLPLLTSNALVIIVCPDSTADEMDQLYAEDKRIHSFLLHDLETDYPELLEAKTNRSLIEYYFTLSPFLPLFAFHKFPFLERITSMDADLFFYQSPEIIFSTYHDADILITPHSFPKDLEYLVIYGQFNVSFQSFKNNSNAISCLKKWATDCIEYCSDKLDATNSKFADQKYLDEWPRLYSGVQSIDLSGAGVAPWNLKKYNLEEKKQQFFIDGAPLIFYHFHHFRLAHKFLVKHAFEKYASLSLCKNNAVLSLYYYYWLKIGKEFSHHVDQTLRYNSYSATGFLKIFFFQRPFMFFLKGLKFSIT